MADKSGNQQNLTRTPRICIIFSDTGGGHRSAAEAVETALLDLLREVEPDSHSAEVMVENVVEKSHPVNRFFVELYNFLLRNNQAGMKYYYWFIEKSKPNNSELGYQMTKPYMLKLFDECDPDIVVSVHPMSNHYFARAIRDSGRSGRTKLVTIVTDPNGDFWSGWACADADLTIVPNELGYNRLIQWGISPQRIKVSGMPVNPDFIKPPSCTKEEFRAHLGLDPFEKTVCINAGWAGGGNMLSIYESLSACARNTQVIFLCGHNQALYNRMKKKAKNAAIPTAVLPFHDRMSDLMAAVDLMVTKAGGLTSFEAVARRLPMAIDMITLPMPQELGTANMLCQQGLAYPVQKPDDIVGIVSSLRSRDDYLANPPKAYDLHRANAVYDIAETLLRMAGVKLKPASAEVYTSKI